MADEYFYFKLGIPRGPFSWAEFVELAKNRKITSKTSCIVNDNPSILAPELFGKHWTQIAAIQEAAIQAENAEREAERQERNRQQELKRLEQKNSGKPGFFTKLFASLGFAKKLAAVEESTTIRVTLIGENEPRPKNGWFKLHNSKWPNLCQWAGSYSNEWKQLATEVAVSGTSNLDYQKNFFMLASAPDFRISLQREPMNPYDRNAIAVLGIAAIDGQSYSLPLGYVAKETAQELANFSGEFSAIPECVWLPMEDCHFGLRITILQRSKIYLKRQN